MRTGIELIADERKRQIEIEGWTAEHDDQHTEGELANAACAYAMTNDMIDFIGDNWGHDMHLHFWPFELNWYKKNFHIDEDEPRIRDLVKAGAMIAAEIDRLIRVQNHECNSKK